MRAATHQLILEGRVTGFLRGRSPLPVVPVAVAHGGGCVVADTQPCLGEESHPKSSDGAAMKISVGTGRTRWAMRWKPALNAFAITFGDRFPAAETY